MLGFLFGLNSRLGRLHFFLSLIGLGFVTAVVLFVLTGRVPQSDQIRGDIAFALAQGPVIIALIVFAVVGLQLLCMRIRDIGWDPVMVMSGWFATLLVDKLIATKLPTLALTPRAFRDGDRRSRQFRAGTGTDVLVDRRRRGCRAIGRRAVGTIRYAATQH